MIKLIDLKNKIRYYPLTGNFNQRTGDQKRLGTFRNIVINNKQYLKSKLAWFYMTGAYPDLKIIFIDGNDRNFKFSNLTIQTHTTVDIIYSDGDFKILIDDNDLGIYNDFDIAVEVIKQCLKSTIKKSKSLRKT